MEEPGGALSLMETVRLLHMPYLGRDIGQTGDHTEWCCVGVMVFPVLKRPEACHRLALQSLKALQAFSTSLACLISHTWHISLASSTHVSTPSF